MAKTLKFVKLGDLFSEMFHFSKGAKFAQLYTEVTPKFNKSSKFYGHVTKKQSHNVQLNFSYPNAVNNLRLKEDKLPDFIPALPSWGTRIPGTPLIMHCKKGEEITEAYLMTRVLKSAPSVYCFDGLVVDSIPMLDAIKKETYKSNSGSKNQGTESEVIIRTFKLSSIKAVTMDGETHVIET